MFLKRFILFFVITFLVALTATGQTPTSPAKVAETLDEKKNDAKSALKAQAYELLDDVLKDVRRLKLAQNRIYLSITVGDLLWEKDEKAARAHFKDAVTDLTALLSEQAETEVAQYSREQVERTQLRERVLFALARHDSHWAMDLLAETRPTLSVKNDFRDTEAELETRLAAVIAANDHTYALELARKNLATGFSHNLPTLLSAVHQKDPAAAAELASEILVRLKATPLGTNHDAARVAVTIFTMSADQTQPKGKASPDDKKPLLTEQSLRELAELIAAAAMDISLESSSRYLYVGPVIAQLEKYAPSRAQQLRRKFSQPELEIQGESQPYQTYQRLMESGTTEEFVAAAEKAEPGMRESLYKQAALKMIEDDKVDEARQMITSKISDPYQRQQMLAEIDKQTLTAAAVNGKMEETRNLISTVGTNEKRIEILTQLATAVAEKGDKKSALQILEEARNLSSGRPRYSRHLLARLQIARAYAAVDTSQSFAILEPTIDQLNELIGAGIVLGEFFGEEEFVKDDELSVKFVGEFSDMFQTQFSKELALLSTADFTRTRNAADRFQRFEVRIMARLLVVQSVFVQKVEIKEHSLKQTYIVQPVPVSP